MRTLLATLALGALTATAAMADPVLGTWASPKNETGGSIHVTIKSCGNTLCGNITKTLGGADASVKGKRMVWDMVAKGGGTYKGKIWAPDSGKTYNGKMQLSGSSLKMSGCVLGICRGETFKRVN